MTALRVEAENMLLTDYRVETGFASGGKYIGLKKGNSQETGTASFNFSGSSGFYNIVVGYFDETDGVSHLEVYRQSDLINTCDFNQNRDSSGANAQTQTQITIATQLLVNQGETFQLQGKEDKGEPARIDYIEFIPVAATKINGTDAADYLKGNAKDNNINGLAGDDTLIGGIGDDKLNGGDGIDTADYTDTVNGITANLDTGVVLAPLFAASTRPKIMPLGDSITAGIHRVNPTPGAYRIQLSTDFLDDGFNVNFVGSQSNGPNSLGDQDHEGHPGWKINQLTSLVKNGLLDTYRPDIILLMVGTNDARSHSLKEIYADLSDLIDQITKRSPNTQLLVSSIVPIDPSVLGQKWADKTKELDALIPDLVDDKVAQGKKVAFVDAGGSLTLDDLTPDGKHPNANGYDKIGDAWYDALVEHDTLTGIENITGTAFDDTLTGNAGVNILDGNAGRDVLTGGAGADTFTYKSPTEGKDKITDFSIDDIFNISASGFGGGLVAGTNLSTSASETGVFVSDATPTSQGSSANFLYNTNTGLLSFDSDGAGPNEALAIAKLSNSPLLGINQFTISS